MLNYSKAILLSCSSGFDTVLVLPPVRRSAPAPASARPPASASQRRAAQCRALRVLGAVRNSPAPRAFGAGPPSAAARSGPQNGAAGAPQPRHMTPCVCHCAACRVAGHGSACVEIRKALLWLFGKADVVDVVLRHYYGACGWDTARLDAAIMCMQYGPAGDVIAAGDSDGRIHLDQLALLTYPATRTLILARG